MAVDHFIPEIWSGILMSSLKKAHVFGQRSISRTEYEGEIASEGGNTVKITSVNRPTIANYVKGTTVITPEQLTTAQRQIVVDQSKYFSFEIDDIDKFQTKDGGKLMREAAQEAAYGLADLADQFLAAKYVDVAAANQMGTVSVTTPALANTVLVDLMVLLDKANVPRAGRWVVIPAWYHGLLVDSDRFVANPGNPSGNVLRNGMVGQAYGFDIYSSNNVVNTTGDDWAVIAGAPGNIGFVEQISKTEPYRPENSFGDALKGLHVYGGKVIRPEGLASVIASET